MSRDGVNVNPDDVRKLATALGAYKQEVTSASKRVRGALSAADWNDARKEQFDRRFQDLQKGIDHFMAGEVDQMIKVLNDLARRLDEIRNIRM